MGVKGRGQRSAGSVQGDRSPASSGAVSQPSPCRPASCPHPAKVPLLHSGGKKGPSAGFLSLPGPALGVTSSALAPCAACGRDRRVEQHRGHQALPSTEEAGPARASDGAPAGQGTRLEQTGELGLGTPWQLSHEIVSDMHKLHRARLGVFFLAQTPDPKAQVL